MPDFSCTSCGSTFTLPASVLERYPGWVPKECSDCRRPSTRRRSATARAKLSTQEVLDGFGGGPQSGAFTDGGASPNPGPGGWGVVYVVGGEMRAERHGSDPDTTNNRMELTALLAALDLVPDGVATTVYTDSRLAVQTINEWAAGWEQRGWRRKTGPVENLDLVKPVFYGFRRRPELTLRWIEAHAGHRWNEYADALANRWRA